MSRKLECGRCGSEIYDTQDRMLILIGHRATNEEWLICRVCEKMLLNFMAGHDAVDREVAAHKVIQKRPTLEDVFCPECGSKTLLKGREWPATTGFVSDFKCGTCAKEYTKSQLKEKSDKELSF